MAMYLPPFDPERDFVAQASFRADGAIWQRGKAFDKSRVSVRVLRQLYEARKINYAKAPKPVEPAPSPQPVPPAVPPSVADPVGSVPTPEIAPTDQDQSEGAAGGEAGGNPPPEPIQEAVDALVAAHSKDQLVTMADGIEGVHAGMNKAVIAEALVKAGRGNS